MTNFLEENFGLKDKVAIVTGGNTGLGKDYVYSLAAAGAKIFVFAYDETNVKEMEADFQANGWTIKFEYGDLTQVSAIKKCVTTCLETFTKIDILVNNAGTISRTPLLEGTDEEWNRVIAINLNAVYSLSREVAKVMKTQKEGKIINIASMLAFQGGKFVPSYTASKHGVVGITKAFANELAQFNIQVNAIAPGYIETANTAPIRADKVRNQEILARIPANYWGKPSDVGTTCVFLASKAADYINGFTIAVDGGWLAR